ncbi:transporter substrate-binding domain-containing protein [Ketogulonicigenium vulgare]|uniref:Uncharacterized protein n=1 Tax=Ketogulonicigenium vulgare (strain WSH-001) TaxID=759362 RepID=F9Y436_KETVW|nr:transporter substrate-binding domain-containing protein [Ketogulonicigenium vulgare]ADO42275.1 conserved hypothetical protein [Ketogulonicigenium vulgare Y25]AEM40472.1 hypothetical protein KVU_0633 [Ketogulonicigenium vulgare WSH-001]ALJ80657.1 hypothetical protein KVH_05375 [Ketogulonicigenium vulgare]ANW33471.1 hypothetical protein KvSKV_05345 [Ketogulonicigenium vulgare]AOZ54188.1 ABC-type amino acid transport/signal transduction systems [Ketogulonicigenium vulgare]
MRFFVSAVIALCPAFASAQLIDQVANPQLMNPNILPSGSTLRACHYRNSPTADLDSAVASEIAARLLMPIEVNEMPSGYGMGGEFAASDMLVALSATCDVIMGMGLGVIPYPPEFTVTRPYATHSFTYLSKDPGFTRLTDIPADRRIGLELASYGAYIFRQFNSLRPTDQQWGYQPYVDHTLLLTRVQDGSIATASIYGPAWRKIEQEEPALLEGLHELERMPAVNAQIDMGAIVLSNNTFLRGELDAAMTEMIGDGTIAELLDRLDYTRFGSTVTAR